MRTRNAARVVAGTVVAAAVLSAAPADGAPADGASTYQAYPVPTDRQLVVRGKGFGHGHGMSQYGAQGAALQGKSYRQILDFYYPGTSMAQVEGPVRVLITADTTPDVVVSPRAGLSVRDLGDRSTFLLPGADAVRRWRLTVRGGKTVVGMLTDRWRRYRPGGRAALLGDGEFFASGPMTLWTPTGRRAYRGRLRAASPSPGSSDRDTVNALTIDKYLRGVVPYEMPASWEPQAVRAQAVAARTYVTWSRAQDRDRYYQVCDTTACQVYGGYGAEDDRSNAAVLATAGRILTYQGRAAFTQFSASSGGWTGDGGMPYLPAQPDPYDGWSGNPVHAWSQRLSANRVEAAYPAIGRLRRILVLDRDGNGAWGGRVNEVLLDGTKQNVRISGDTFRSAFGLRSNWFAF